MQHRGQLCFRKIGFQKMQDEFLTRLINEEEDLEETVDDENDDDSSEETDEDTEDETTDAGDNEEPSIEEEEK